MSKFVPVSRPKITQEELELLTSKYGVSSKDGCLIVGLRGYYKKSMGNPLKNDVGINDDAVIVVSPDAYKTFNGNTDPSKLNTGLATLVAGVYKFYKGLHKGSAKVGYPALRAYPDGVVLPAIRDGKKSTCSYINIHKGGFSNTYSAGCQTIFPEQYQEFLNLVYKQMDKYQQRTVTYLLAEV